MTSVGLIGCGGMAQDVVATLRGTRAVSYASACLIAAAVIVLILLVLFAVQSRGTARVAAFFGPVMCIWFAVIAVAALHPIIQHP